MAVMPSSPRSLVASLIAWVCYRTGLSELSTATHPTQQCTPYWCSTACTIVYRIGELSKRKLLVFVWRCLHGKASATLSVLFVRSAGRRTRHQRSSGLLSQPSSTRSGASRPSVAGSALWNLLPDDVRTIARQNTFSISCLPYCCSD